MLGYNPVIKTETITKRSTARIIVAAVVAPISTRPDYPGDKDGVFSVLVPFSGAMPRLCDGKGVRVRWKMGLEMTMRPVPMSCIRGY